MQVDREMTAKKSGIQTLGVLARNTEFVKVMVANGIMLVGKLVVLMLVLPEVRAKIWSTDMAEFQAMVSLGLALTAVLTSGLFGRFSDKVGRRAAAAVLGICSFAPAWGVLAFGLNERGLYASCVGSVISGVGVNSNVLLVLASDVTDPADREAAFGAFQAVSLFMQFLLLGLPSLFIATFKVLSNNPIAILIYQAVLSVLYFLILASVRVPQGEVAATDTELEVQRAASRSCCGQIYDAIAGLLAPLKLCGQSTTRNLAFSFFLVAFSGDLLMDIGSQFFRQALGLVPFGTPHQHQMVNVASSLPAQVLVLPGYVLVGIVAQRFGSLRVLLLLIPFSAVLQALGATLIWMPKVWFVGLVTVAQAYGQLLNVPLQHLVTVYAPPGQEGEVMGTMGACQQLANMLGNLAVIVVTPFLQRCGIENPLWVYYPCAGIIVFLAVFPAGALATSGVASAGKLKSPSSSLTRMPSICEDSASDTSSETDEEDSRDDRATSFYDTSSNSGDDELPRPKGKATASVLRNFSGTSLNSMGISGIYPGVNRV